MRRFAFIAAAILAACGSPSVETGRDGGSGNQGSGGGAGTSGGGTGTSGGGAGHLGGGAAASGGGAAGGGSASPFTVSGTVTAPAGLVTSGVSVVLCGSTPTGACDQNTSWVYSVSAATQSASFAFPSVAPGTYTLFALKDVNANDTLDVGDWVAGYNDTAGSLKVISSATSGVTLTMFVVPPPSTSLPAELVGTWDAPTTTELGANYSFMANATYTYVFLYDNKGSCLVMDRLEISESGGVSVAGNSLTLTPTINTNKEWSCYGTVTTTTKVPQPRNFTWRVAPNTGGGTSLFLQAAGGSESEFKKQ